MRIFAVPSSLFVGLLAALAIAPAAADAENGAPGAASSPATGAAEQVLPAPGNGSGGGSSPSIGGGGGSSPSIGGGGGSSPSIGGGGGEAGGPSSLPVLGGGGQVHIYVDSKGARHTWSISSAHALQWDGAPWIPTGLTFAALLLDPGSNTPLAERQAADNARLDALQAAGIHDLLVEAPAGTSPLDAPPAALQALLDELDRRGFHYGVDLHGELQGKLPGFSFGEPALVGQATAGGAFQAAAPEGATSALFVARDQNGAVVHMGIVPAQDRVFSATAAGATSVYFVAQRQRGAAEGVGSLWDGFPSTRDKVLFGLHPIRFGSGLRFLLNPVEEGLTPGGEAVSFYPDSRRFRLAFETWLRRRYPNLTSLGQYWSVPDGTITSYTMAAGLVPNGASHPTALWDPEKDTVLTVNPDYSTFWSDFEEFRLETAQHNMDLLAGSLRHNIADVPVVYRWERFSKLYGASGDTVSFDGLAVSPPDATGRAETEEAYTYAQVADTSPDRWFLMYGGGPGETLGRLATLIDLGAKGFFLDPAAGSQTGAGPDAAPGSGAAAGTTALTASIAGPGATALTGNSAGAGSTALAGSAGAQNALVVLGSGSAAGAASSPDSGVFLVKALRDSLFNPAARGGSALHDAGNYADYSPSVLWFPWDLQVASARRLNGGAWWLPTLRAGTPIAVGPDLEAYQLTDPSGTHIFVWSARGPQTVHMPLPLSAHISWPADARFGKDVHGQRSLSLTDQPTVLDGVQPTDLFPQETVERVLDEVDLLRNSPMLEQQDRERLVINAATARRMTADGLSHDAYLLVSQQFDAARRLLLPLIWLEGENAAPSSFSGVASSAQCSNNAYLWLKTPDDPPAGKPYSASWTFDCRTTGSYDFWMGGTAPGEDWSSPVSWTLDGAPLPVVAHGIGGTPYQPIFHWAWLTQLHLAAGSHTLKATVTGRRVEPDNSYFLGIDAIAFSPTPDLVRQVLHAGDVTTTPAANPRTPRRGRHGSSSAADTPQAPATPDVAAEDARLKQEAQDALNVLRGSGSKP